MNDKGFFDNIVAERMQMHYSMRKGATADGEATDALRLEQAYTQVLETLPVAAREAVGDFVKCLNSRAASDETFFYMRGLKDGLLLYELLVRL